LDDDETAAREAQRVEDAEDELESYERLLHMSAADRSRLEAQGGSAGLPFEGDERLQIPVGTDEMLARAIRNYWSAWSEQRDAVLERHAEAQKRADKFRKKQRKAPSANALRKLQASDPVAFAAFDAEAQFAMHGGPLGIEMMSFAADLGPIELHEIPAIAIAPKNSLRDRPPVRMFWRRVVQPDSVRPLSGHLDEEEACAVVAGAGSGAPLETLRNALPSARKLLELVESGVADVDVLRPAYREFALEFWTWREEQHTETSLKRHISEIPSGDVFWMPSATVFQAAHRAVVSRKDWTHNGTDYPRYDDPPSMLSFSIGGQTGDGSFDPKTENGFAADLASLDPEWSVVYAAAMGAWTSAFHQGKLTTGAGVAIHVNDILELRGLKRHQSRDFRPEQKREIAITMKRLAKLRVRGEYTQPDGKKRRLTGALIEIVEDEVDDLFGFTPYGFVIRPGLAVQPLFEQSPQFALFFTQLANLDTRQGVEKIAYLIGLYLAFQWRIRQTYDVTQPFKIRTLFNGARVPIQANSKHYTRFKDQIEAALDRLAHNGIVAEWQYQGDDEQNLPDHGWFQPWLECRVVIKPPESIMRDAAIRTENKRKSIQAKSPRSTSRRRHTPS